MFDLISIEGQGQGRAGQAGRADCIFLFNFPNSECLYLVNNKMTIETGFSLSVFYSQLAICNVIQLKIAEMLMPDDANIVLRQHYWPGCGGVEVR